MVVLVAALVLRNVDGPGMIHGLKRWRSRLQAFEVVLAWNKYTPLPSVTLLPILRSRSSLLIPSSTKQDLLRSCSL